MFGAKLFFFIFNVYLFILRERERVSKGQRFYWGLGAVGEVMAMASADWLGRGPGEGSGR